MKGICYTLSALIVLSMSSSYAESKIEDFLPCAYQPEKQAARSQELKDLFDGDEKDREYDPSGHPEDHDQHMMENDLARRIRVGQIFGEGCINTAADYAHAAMIYQHGDIPDHFYQTFLWAKKAVELGDKSQINLMALATDRYLVSIGHKQLFGSQFFSSAPDYCYCVEPVEPSFPEALRVQYTNVTLQARYAKLDELNQGKGCKTRATCDRDLLSTEKGAMPGVW